MLSRLGYASDRWEATCSGCLAHSPILDGTEAEVRAALEELGWELPRGEVYCGPCSSLRRAPLLPLTRRGRRSRKP